jgi:uncharacterized protein YggE
MIPKSGNRFSDKIMRKEKWVMMMLKSRVLFSALVIAAAALVPLAAQAAEKIEKLVTVTGEGMVTAAPDSAMVRLGVSSQGKTARAASDVNAKDMNAVLAAIKETGIAERDIRTTSLSLNPIYDPNKTGPARLTGFRANNQVSVKIRDIGKLPGVLDRAIAAGANEMSGIEFLVSTQAKLLDQARAAAIADAHRKAELYANAAGMKVGRVMSIAEEGAQPPAPVFRALRAGASVPIAPGEQSLRAVVTVSYELTS